MSFFTAFTRSYSSFAASFDCAEAKTRIETAICSDTALSELDALLAADLKAAFTRQRNRRLNLLSQQRAWLHDRNQKCSATGYDVSEAIAVVECLRFNYANRIAELTKDLPDSIATVDGRWSETYPCRGSKEECSGRSDVFSLDLGQVGRGFAAVTSRPLISAIGSMRTIVIFLRSWGRFPDKQLLLPSKAVGVGLAMPK